MRWSDEDDLAQECSLHWSQVRSSYRPAGLANRSTYLKRVVGHQLLDLFRHERTRGRVGHLMASSLDEPVARDGEETGLRGDFLADRRSVTAGLEFELDVARAQRDLTRRQREILAGRTGGYRVTELASELGVHRDTIHTELKRIQEVFRDHGLAGGR